MIDDTPLTASESNRRDNFRVDDVLPVSLRKVESKAMPTAHIFPVTIDSATTGTWEGGMISTLVEPDSNFALLMIEVSAKLDLLLGASDIQGESVEDTSPARLSMHQLLVRINVKLEHLLGARHLVRPDDRIRIDTVCLSASGIRLKTEEAFSTGDLVEVRILMNISKPFWIVVGGRVVRVSTKPTGKHEVAIRFAGMNETVQDEISRYALLTQKKQLLARRGIQS